MFHPDRFSPELENFVKNSIHPFKTTGEFITPLSFPQRYYDQILQIKENYQNINHNDHPVLQDWCRGCEIVGFLPDNPVRDNSTSDHLATKYKHKPVHRRNSYQWYSTTPAQNDLRVNLKRKKKRTAFTTEQIIALEGIFQKKPYVDKGERIAIMNRLQVSEKSIKVWFQNRRRVLEKKNTVYVFDSPSSCTSDTVSDRLTVIENQIKENTDENGYVTLHSSIINELVNIIDEYLSKDVNLGVTEAASHSAEEIVMYEPISPASSEEMSESYMST